MEMKMKKGIAMKNSATWALAAGFAIAVLGCRNNCEDLPLAAVDYKNTGNWLCRPGADDACSQPRAIHDVKLDGTVNRIDEGIAKDRAVDCFYVYPTMDLTLAGGVHEDLADRAKPIEAIRTQAARFGEICSVYAPVYRQVTIGTYIQSEEKRKPCFDVAYSDIQAAFDHYMANDNKGRGIILIGHSQGAQVISRLIRERFDNNETLRKQLIAAMPIGWPVGTDTGSLLGGSFEKVPVCTKADETGCAIAFRSFGAGNDLPAVNGELREGDSIVCHNPASPNNPQSAARLKDITVRADWDFKNRPAGVPDDANAWVRYADAYEARCVSGENGGAALEVKWSPAAGDMRPELIDMSAGLISGDLGTHVLDIAFTQADLIADADHRAQLWLSQSGTP